MKAQRVIYHLSDGRKKYGTHHGQLEKWTIGEIDNLCANIEKYGHGAFTADFTKFDFTPELLRGRFPKAKIIKITAVDWEDADLPFNPNIIF